MEKVIELKQNMSRPDFWSDRERAVVISRQADELSEETARWEKLKKEIRELEELVAEAVRTGDITVADTARSQYEELKKRLEGFEFFVLFSGRYDNSNAIISVHAGTGGVDAQDWAEMLLRMYLRFSEKRGFKAAIVDRTDGNEAGIKSATLEVRGRWAYGNLKGEAGVHRLVRISPFDAEAMRHTSFALVEVIPELPETAQIALKESDLRIDVYRSSGPGGQSVNTTDSAVRIKHLSSGIVVACQNERSQHQNKETALKILKSKLYLAEEAKRQAEEQKLRGETQKAEWGKQIRSYFLEPYQLVKDHRTGYATPAVHDVLNGALEKFAEAYLRWLKATGN
jgi:peptide chain release factor 2